MLLASASEGSACPAGRRALDPQRGTCYVLPVLAETRDAHGHHIYLTHERWGHICEVHPEMEEALDRVLDTVRLGRRFQDSVRLDVFSYYRDYAGLPSGNTTVVVRFGIRTEGTPNNFVLTAYQISRRAR